MVSNNELLGASAHLHGPNQDETNNELSNKGISRNSIAFPDLYVPLMGFITYLLVIALNLGTDNQYIACNTLDFILI